MKKKLLATMIIAVFVASIVFNAGMATSTPIRTSGVLKTSGLPEGSRPAFEESDDLEGIDGTPRFHGLAIDGIEPDTGNPWWVPVIDDYTGLWDWLAFEVVASGEHCNIWIGLSPDVWNGYQDYYDPKGPGFDDDEWHFMYPWTWEGIPEYGIPPGYHDVIYGKNLTYTVDEFDNNIWGTDTEFFGMYADRPGPLDDYKIQILIFNIRDGLFWDPVNAPWFIQGYFWSFASELNNANIFHMDTWQWYARLGPQPPPSTHSYEYEGTFAHEFQHLIHYDVDSDEMVWVNEGCSTLAEYICGYGFSPGHISDYLIYWWDTSLVIWEDYLSNYGAAFLWTFYMYEHYGGAELIWDIVHEQANGIEGYNKVLKDHHIKKTFDEIFQDWAIANYLDDTTFADGIYGYYDLDIPSADTEWYDIPFVIWMWDYLYPWFDISVDTYPNYGYNYPYGTSLPYTVNYVEFYNYGPKMELYFDGDDYCGVFAHSGMYQWYSDGTEYSWFRLGQTFDLTSVTEATLKFWSNYEIETNWDYGYVEVHDLDTDEWYTLPGLATISTIPEPQDNPNCPDEFEPTTYLAAGRWHAFTGFSGGWYQEEMDLTPFAGHTIELYFTYWTDPYTLELGWYVDDIEIPEIGFFDDVESGASGWTYTGWDVSTGVLENDFGVSFLRTLVHTDGPDTDPWITYDVIRMELDDDTEDGWQNIKAINQKTVFTYGPALMVAANQPGYEHDFRTFYWFYANIRSPGPLLLQLSAATIQ